MSGGVPMAVAVEPDLQALREPVAEQPVPLAQMPDPDPDDFLTPPATPIAATAADDGDDPSGGGDPDEDDIHDGTELAVQLALRRSAPEDLDWLRRIRQRLATLVEQRRPLTTSRRTLSGLPKEPRAESGASLPVPSLIPKAVVADPLDAFRAHLGPFPDPRKLPGFRDTNQTGHVYLLEPGVLLRSLAWVLVSLSDAELASDRGSCLALVPPGPSVAAGDGSRDPTSPWFRRKALEVGQRLLDAGMLFVHRQAPSSPQNRYGSELAQVRQPTAAPGLHRHHSASLPGSPIKPNGPPPASPASPPPQPTAAAPDFMPSAHALPEASAYDELMERPGAAAVVMQGWLDYPEGPRPLHRRMFSMSLSAARSRRYFRLLRHTASGLALLCWYGSADSAAKAAGRIPLGAGQTVVEAAPDHPKLAHALTIRHGAQVASLGADSAELRDAWVQALKNPASAPGAGGENHLPFGSGSLAAVAGDASVPGAEESCTGWDDDFPLPREFADVMLPGWTRLGDSPLPAGLHVGLLVMMQAPPSFGRSSSSLSNGQQPLQLQLPHSQPQATSPSPVEALVAWREGCGGLRASSPTAAAGPPASPVRPARPLSPGGSTTTAAFPRTLGAGATTQLAPWSAASAALAQNQVQPQGLPTMGLAATLQGRFGRLPILALFHGGNLWLFDRPPATPLGSTRSPPASSSSRSNEVWAAVVPQRDCRGFMKLQPNASFYVQLSQVSAEFGAGSGGAAAGGGKSRGSRRRPEEASQAMPGWLDLHDRQLCPHGCIPARRSSGADNEEPDDQVLGPQVCPRHGSGGWTVGLQGVFHPSSLHQGPRHLKFVMQTAEQASTWSELLSTSGCRRQASFPRFENRPPLLETGISLATLLETLHFRPCFLDFVRRQHCQENVLFLDAVRQYVFAAQAESSYLRGETTGTPATSAAAPSSGACDAEHARTLSNLRAAPATPRSVAGSVSRELFPSSSDDLSSGGSIRRVPTSGDAPSPQENLAPPATPTRPARRTLTLTSPSSPVKDRQAHGRSPPPPPPRNHSLAVSPTASLSPRRASDTGTRIFHSALSSQPAQPARPDRRWLRCEDERARSAAQAAAAADLLVERLRLAEHILIHFVVVPDNRGGPNGAAGADPLAFTIDGTLDPEGADLGLADDTLGDYGWSAGAPAEIVNLPGPLVSHLKGSIAKALQLAQSAVAQRASSNQGSEGGPATEDPSILPSSLPLLPADRTIPESLRELRRLLDTDFALGEALRSALPENLFLGAAKEIFQLLWRDVYTRFLAAPEYLELLRSAEAFRHRLSLVSGCQWGDTFSPWPRVEDRFDRWPRLVAAVLRSGIAVPVQLPRFFGGISEEPAAAPGSSSGSASGASNSSTGPVEVRCVLGAHLVAWFVEQGLAHGPEPALALAQQLLNRGWLVYMGSEPTAPDDVGSSAALVESSGEAASPTDADPGAPANRSTTKLQLVRPPNVPQLLMADPRLLGLGPGQFLATGGRHWYSLEPERACSARLPIPVPAGLPTACTSGALVNTSDNVFWGGSVLVRIEDVYCRCTVVLLKRERMLLFYRSEVSTTPFAFRHLSNKATVYAPGLVSGQFLAPPPESSWNSADNSPGSSSPSVYSSLASSPASASLAAAHTSPASRRGSGLMPQRRASRPGFASGQSRPSAVANTKAPQSQSRRPTLPTQPQSNSQLVGTFLGHPQQLQEHIHDEGVLTPNEALVALVTQVHHLCLRLAAADPASVAGGGVSGEDPSGTGSHGEGWEASQRRFLELAQQHIQQLLLMPPKAALDSVSLQLHLDMLLAAPASTTGNSSSDGKNDVSEAHGPVAAAVGDGSVVADVVAPSRRASALQPGDAVGPLSHHQDHPRLSFEADLQSEALSPTVDDSLVFPASLPRPDLQEVQLEGWLDKQNSGGLVSLRPWNRRYFVLAGRHLFCFRGVSATPVTAGWASTETPVEAYPLRWAAVLPSKRGDSCEFVVQPFGQAGRQLVLRAGSAAARDAWLRALFAVASEDGSGTPPGISEHPSEDSQGWLWKLGGSAVQLGSVGGSNKFQQRWVRLRGERLLYFRRQADAEPAGALCLVGASVQSYNPLVAASSIPGGAQNSGSSGGAAGAAAAAASAPVDSPKWLREHMLSLTLRDTPELLPNCFDPLMQGNSTVVEWDDMDLQAVRGQLWDGLRQSPVGRTYIFSADDPRVLEAWRRRLERAIAAAGAGAVALGEDSVLVGRLLNRFRGAAGSASALPSSTTAAGGVGIGTGGSGALAAGAAQGRSSVADHAGWLEHRRRKRRRHLDSDHSAASSSGWAASSAAASLEEVGDPDALLTEPLSELGRRHGVVEVLRVRDGEPLWTRRYLALREGRLRVHHESGAGLSAVELQLAGALVLRGGGVGSGSALEFQVREFGSREQMHFRAASVEQREAWVRSLLEARALAPLPWDESLSGYLWRLENTSEQSGASCSPSDAATAPSSPVSTPTSSLSSAFMSSAAPSRFKRCFAAVEPRLGCLELLTRHPPAPDSEHLAPKRLQLVPLRPTSSAERPRQLRVVVAQHPTQPYAFGVVAVDAPDRDSHHPNQSDLDKQDGGADPGSAALAAASGPGSSVPPGAPQAPLVVLAADSVEQRRQWMQLIARCIGTGAAEASSVLPGSQAVAADMPRSVSQHHRLSGTGSNCLSASSTIPDNLSGLGSLPSLTSFPSRSRGPSEGLASGLPSFAAAGTASAVKRRGSSRRSSGIAEISSDAAGAGPNRSRVPSLSAGSGGGGSNASGNGAPVAMAALPGSLGRSSAAPNRLPRVPDLSRLGVAAEGGVVYLRLDCQALGMDAAPDKGFGVGKGSARQESDRFVLLRLPHQAPRHCHHASGAPGSIAAGAQEWLVALAEAGLNFRTSAANPLDQVELQL